MDLRSNFNLKHVIYQSLDNCSKFLNSISLPEQVVECLRLSVPSLPEVLEVRKISC